MREKMKKNHHCPRSIGCVTLRLDLMLLVDQGSSLFDSSAPSHGEQQNSCQNFVCDTSLMELELWSSMSQPVAGWRAMPRQPCLSLSGLGPWHGPCRRAWHDQDLHDSNSDPLAFVWDCACSPEAPSILWRLGQCMPNVWLESKASRGPSQSRPASV
jgi:hypothetical protein